MKFPPFHWRIGLSVVSAIASSVLPVATVVVPAINSPLPSNSIPSRLSQRLADSSSVQLAQNSATCRQTTTRILVYEQPDTSSAVVGQPISTLTQVTLDRAGTFRSDGRPLVNGWARLAAPSRGYVLSRYLAACSSASANPPSQTPVTAPIVRGCALVQSTAALGATTLGIRRRIEGSPYTSVPSGSRLILGDPDSGTVRNGSRDPRNLENRYWVRVLAMELTQGGRSPHAWVAETGPNAPSSLIRSPNGILEYQNGRAYENENLNIVRRSCTVVFPNSGVVQGQHLPRRLPSGMQTP